MTEKYNIPVACPCCKNKRMFDFIPETVGAIKIKCRAFFCFVLNVDLRRCFPVFLLQREVVYDGYP